MELDDFRAELLNDVAVLAQTTGTFRHHAFVERVAEILADAGEVSDLQPAYYRGEAGSHPLALDGYSFDEADDSLRVFVAVPEFGPAPKSMDKDATNTHLARLARFVREAAKGTLHRDLEPSAPAYAAAQDIAERWAGIGRVRAYLLTDGVLSTKTKDWPEGEVAGAPLEYHIWDIERMRRAQTAASGREDLVIDLTRWGGLPCIPTDQVSEDYRAYLSIVPGETLAQLYEEHGSRLLEGNVRSFLAARGRINKGIRNTILHDRDMFFAYNNGIAATAIDATVDYGTNGTLRLTSVTDLQIVNGGQTTASLATTRRVDKATLNGLFVAMKLSIVTPEKASVMVPNIARYANTQNRVNEADFFSNHDYHRRLEDFSRRLLVPARPGAQHETKWYYERSRGQYGNETFKSTASERRRFEETYPRSQVYSKTDLAKSEMSWNQHPHWVSLGAQKNFLRFADRISSEWDKNEDQFHEQYFRSTVARFILFRALEKLVSQQPWYSGGYRANIVAYTMAKLAHLIEGVPGHFLDVETIWRTQSLTPALTEELTSIAEAMHDVITDPPVGVQNVTEWAKREQCWKAAAATRLQLSADFERELIAAGEIREVQREATKQIKMDRGIDAQTKVVLLGQEYWAWVRDWGRARTLLSSRDDGVLGVAASIPNQVPTEAQSKVLLQLKTRLETEGLEPRQIPDE